MVMPKVEKSWLIVVLWSNPLIFFGETWVLLVILAVRSCSLLRRQYRLLTPVRLEGVCYLFQKEGGCLSDQLSQSFLVFRQRYVQIADLNTVNRNFGSRRNIVRQYRHVLRHIFDV